MIWELFGIVKGCDLGWFMISRCITYCAVIAFAFGSTGCIKDEVKDHELGYNILDADYNGPRYIDVIGVEMVANPPGQTQIYNVTFECTVDHEIFDVDQLWRYELNGCTNNRDVSGINGGDLCMSLQLIENNSFIYNIVHFNVDVSEYTGGAPCFDIYIVPQSKENGLETHCF